MSEALAQAKSVLQMSIDTAENNIPINLAEGNMEQAKLEREVSADCKEALELIESELAGLDTEMRDKNSDYHKGRLAPLKQKRYRELHHAKQNILNSA